MHRHRKAFRFLLRLIAGGVALAAGAGPAAAAAPEARPGWTQVWADEFDAPGAPDPAKWGYERGFVRNRERQYYTADRRENARVEDGCLVIEARKETLGRADITSASLITRGKAAWTGGRVEARAKLPGARGTWPAIWMLGEDRERRGWPACGEIDIMEHVGHEPGRIHGTVHTERYNHTRGSGRGGATDVADAASAFHVYAIEWDPERIRFFVDDQAYFTVEKKPGDGRAEWPFDQPCYLLLNLAIGGAWGGQKGVDEAALPQRLLVDYVRVYRRAVSASAPSGRGT